MSGFVLVALLIVGQVNPVSLRIALIKSEQRAQVKRALSKCDVDCSLYVAHEFEEIAVKATELYQPGMKSTDLQREVRKWWKDEGYDPEYKCLNAIARAVHLQCSTNAFDPEDWGFMLHDSGEDKIALHRQWKEQQAAATVQMRYDNLQALHDRDLYGRVSNWEVGAIGPLKRAEIVQILDSGSALAKMSDYRLVSQGPDGISKGPLQEGAMFHLGGVDTTHWVDGQKLALEGVFVVKGTYQYEMVTGASRTVLDVCPAADEQIEEALGGKLNE